jgi:hypothetical protein
MAGCAKLGTIAVADISVAVRTVLNTFMAVSFSGLICFQCRDNGHAAGLFRQNNNLSFTYY